MFAVNPLVSGRAGIPTRSSTPEPIFVLHFLCCIGPNHGPRPGLSAWVLAAGTWTVSTMGWGPKWDGAGGREDTTVHLKARERGEPPLLETLSGEGALQCCSNLIPYRCPPYKSQVQKTSALPPSSAKPGGTKAFEKPKPSRECPLVVVRCQHHQGRWFEFLLFSSRLGIIGLGGHTESLF